ncbi:sensor domain-containing diguanylate cyclase [Colwellia sp. D2M02]|uniref:sensor domain-containing diguanylate cyclase n=1 Tax=Colwellia sp. D2M02 TaxID=2841562 RepID=UPI001C09DA3A|nr:sensor domain-containing diguanylate cyclase [Colwellia sp. D2M02]MBU2893054.1 sensor domain-containing diguanylate cyclase [Colwellia sp. D2M02]
MRFNYQIIVIITALLFVLSSSLTLINYFASINSTTKHLKESALPLTVDNIYTEIQKNIIEPSLIASMMSSDTFMKDWLTHEEDDIEQITRFLDTIQNKYKMYTTFLVSEKSQHYYTASGVLDKLSADKAHNQWYFKFKSSSKSHEINIDYNENIGDSLIMFINYKIFDDEYHMIGATGIGLKTSYINEMLKYFRLQYNFNVYLIDEQGEVVVSERSVNNLANISDISALKSQLSNIINKNNLLLEYNQNNNDYLLNAKYIPELDLYLIVEAKVDNFTASVKETFYLNVCISLIITLLIAVIIIFYVRSIHNKLNTLANTDPLTELANRRTFYNILEHSLLLTLRNNTPLSTLFIDIDNFKTINDTLGHDIGDKTLKSLADILTSSIRKSDTVARWGGEEFIILLEDTNLAHANLIAEQLRSAVEKNVALKEITNKGVTISIGVTTANENDTVESLFKRIDNALYSAKNNGKNCIAVETE